MVMPDAELVKYQVNVRRVMNRSLKLGIADGAMFVDGRKIYEAADLRVGRFSEEQLRSGVQDA